MPLHRFRPSSDPRLTIVVPARNEARNLEIVLPLLPPVHQVVVVDGHSVDDTREVVADLLPSADFVQQTRRGKGNALACGFEAATGDIVVMFDADGSADAREIDAYVGALLSGADFAKGSRVLAAGGSEDITVIRDAGNRCLTWLTNLLFRTRYTDLCYGYNAFWADVLPELAVPHSSHARPQWGDGFEIETLINCRVAAAGLQIHEVPSVELSRVHGESNLHAVRDGLRVLRTILTERVRRPRVHSAVPSADAVPGMANSVLHVVAFQNGAAQDGSVTTAPSAYELAPQERRRHERRTEAGGGTRTLERRRTDRRLSERRGAELDAQSHVIDLAGYERRRLRDRLDTEESA